MSTSITPFSFDGMAVRAVQVDGDTWFVAADVCAILDLGNVTMALKRLDPDEQALISIEGFSRGNGSTPRADKVPTGERVGVPPPHGLRVSRLPGAHLLRPPGAQGHNRRAQ